LPQNHFFAFFKVLTHIARLFFFALIFAVFSQLLSKFLVFNFIKINLFTVFRIPRAGKRSWCKEKIMYDVTMSETF